MPLSINPDDLIPFSLASDEKADPKPTFRLRFLTYAQRSQAIQLLADAIAAEEAKDRGKVAELLDALMAVGVAKWDNIPVPFKPTHEHLTETELWELAVAVVKRPRLTEEERKNSERPVSSSTVASANGAAVDSAATSPPTTDPTSSPAPNATATAAPAVADAASSR